MCVRIFHDWLVEKKTKTRVTIEKDSLVPQITAHMAPLCMILAPDGALDGTRGRAVVQ